ncbi:hypothetical protein Desor_3256 [Desulfosporosinus orientis DSM 765]|uniref:Uncharacterized protein n=2 Tax=Desulfosporosinus orientis TaxID=1563 RepID=G7WBK1_DESOD|nr:hypothetical protein Desor_3256 [Desulfosporosinus orientis DSM 765]
MSIVLGVLRSVFFLAVALYIYYFTRRKQHDVVIQMWFAIIVGMFASLAIQLVNVSIGKLSWSSIQISFILLTGILIYSVWKAMTELKKRRVK